MVFFSRLSRRMKANSGGFEMPDSPADSAASGLSFFEPLRENGRRLRTC
jgi:hypothetical protein